MKENQSVSVRDHPPILLLILSESLQVNVLLSPPEVIRKPYVF